MSQASDQAIERIAQVIEATDNDAGRGEFQRGWCACLEMIKAAINVGKDSYLFEGGLRSRIDRLEARLGDDPRFGTIASRLGALEDRREDTEKRLSATEARLHGWSADMGISDILARLQRLETIIEPTEAVVNALAKWTRR